MARVEFNVRTFKDPDTGAETFVPLALETSTEGKDKEKVYLCTLTGDAGTKDLYRGDSQVTQQRVWRHWTGHYKARAEAEGWKWPNGV